MGQIIDKSYISLLQGLSLNLSLKLKNNRLGKKRSSAKGSSVEFSDYREYIPGDDYRRIDWSALARFEKMFIKLYMEEQESPMRIFLDCSKSMSFQKKREIAIKTAALFAYTSLAEYDSVSTMFFNDKIEKIIKNVNSKQGFFKIAGFLEDLEFDGDSNLLSSIMSIPESRKKGYTIIISDFLYDAKLDEVLSKLAYSKQRVIICQVLDNSELKPSFETNVRLKDSENLSEINIDINEYTMAIYQENLKKHLSEIEKICDKHKASYFLINADNGIEAFIHSIVNLG